jgi:hypothetical protein
MEHAEEIRELIRSFLPQPITGGDGISRTPARVPAVPVTTDQKILDEAGKNPAAP